MVRWGQGGRWSHLTLWFHSAGPSSSIIWVHLRLKRYVCCSWGSKRTVSSFPILLHQYWSTRWFVIAVHIFTTSVQHWNVFLVLFFYYSLIILLRPKILCTLMWHEFKCFMITTLINAFASNRRQKNKFIMAQMFHEEKRLSVKVHSWPGRTPGTVFLHISQPSAL